MGSRWPFLLVHLGGADSITAFTLQDNDFWRCHALAVLFQTLSSTYIFFQTQQALDPHPPRLRLRLNQVLRENSVPVPRQLQQPPRILAEDARPGASYSRIMSLYSWQRNSNLPTRVPEVDPPTRLSMVSYCKLSGSDVILFVYQFLEMAKRLSVDLKCSHHQREKIREFFLRRTAEDAFGMIEIELHSLYDILFTKASVLYTRNGIFLRSFSFALMVISCGLSYHAQRNFRGVMLPSPTHCF